AGPTGGASVRAEGWGWRHAGRSAWAVRDVDLVIEPGERVLLLGASGAGKTTLLHALAGVLGGDDEGEARGSLRVDGQDPAEPRGRAGLVLQDPDAQVILSRVGDDVAFGCENLGVPREEIWPRVRAALDAVGLDVALDRSTTALSGGQKQRLALAGVLAMRPGLLLLDEPTANLDPEGVGEVRRAVEAVVGTTGATLVVIEHRVAVWQDLVDRVVVLAADGGILADGAPDDVLREQGAALASAGVWVPGREPSAPARRRAATVPLVRADDLVVGRG
uniref:ABC transporter ATP-binding protein n=1 Tax=Clavibacter sp. MX14-G9D TaxID=3064656 RepID=UPI00293EB0CC